MKIKSISLGLICAAALAGRARAAETTYGAGAQALPMQQAGGTARAMGMASAVVAVRQDSASLLWNPAGLSGMSCKEVAVHHNSGLGGSTQEIFVFGAPLGEVKKDGKGGSLGGLAASFGYVNYGEFDGADAAGRPTQSYSAADYTASVGYGKEVLPGLSAGVALKGNQSNFASKVYSTYSTDIGVLWKAAPKLDLGLAYSNLGLYDKIGSQASGWRLGAAYAVDRHWLLAASSELQNKAMRRLQLGTEYLIGDVEGKANVLALRGGYQLSFPNRELGALAGLTWGLGYTITRAVAVDYAMLPAGDLGISHRLSLTYKFGCPAEHAHAAPVAAKPVPAPAPAVSTRAAVAPPAVSTPTASVPAEPTVLASIELEASHFDYNKSTLRPQAFPVLDENVKLLEKYPQARVRVAGYASASGKPAYNQTLSERRAEAVRDHMVKKGIAASRITTIGYGETRPKTYEKKPADKRTQAAQDNMRVVFDITIKN